MLVKQIPQFEALTLGPDGRLVRDGLELEMNPYCRRAVSAGVDFAKEHGGSTTVFTLGPPAAIDVLSEAVAWGTVRGVLVSDLAFAGSDTLATAHALRHGHPTRGPVRPRLRRSQLGRCRHRTSRSAARRIARLRVHRWPRKLAFNDGVLAARLEHDDGFVSVHADLPAVVSCAERLCEPCKIEPALRLAVPADRIIEVSANDLGAGPWGLASPTHVGTTRPPSPPPTADHP